MIQENSSIDFEYSHQNSHTDLSIQQLFSSPQLLSLADPQHLLQLLPLDSKNAYNLLILYLFGSYDRYLTLKTESDKMNKGLCACSINGKQTTYRCDDCGRQTNYHIYCKKCFEAGFEKGIHKGHRYKSKSHRSGCCDCGDINALEATGFCPQHNGSSVCEKELDKDLYLRLFQIMMMTFDLLFKLCENKLDFIRILNSNPENVHNSPIEINYKIANIVSILTKFIGEFCKDKPPLQFAISNILLIQTNKERFHTCKQYDFLKALKKRQSHICQNSIAKLIMKYSIVLEEEEKDISTFLYSLFVNEEFKLKLAEIYLQCFQFMCIFILEKNYPVMKIMKMYQIYCQFFGDKYTNKLINSPQFYNVTRHMKFGLQQINGEYFKEIYKSVIQLIQMFYRLKTVCEQEKQQSLSLKLIGEIIQLSYTTVKKEGYSFDHHKIKIYMVYLLIEVVQELSSIIKFENQSSKELQYKLIQSYFLNSQVLSLEQISHQDKSQKEGQIIFSWICTPQLCIGILLINFFLRFGKQEVQKLFDIIKDSGSISKYIRTIMNAQADAYRISKSNQVGFPGEFPPKDLYRYFYKHPSRSIYDCTISIIQLMALIVPQQFLIEVKNLSQQHMIQLLSDVICQQSCFINASSKLKLENKYSTNGLKIELINILNLRNRSTFKDLKSIYTSHIFSQIVSFNQTLQQNAIFDPKTQTYSIKPEYSGLTESILIRRSEDQFGKLFEQESPETKLLNKDNLIQKQEDKGWETVCSLASKELGRTSIFHSFYEQLVRMIWESNSTTLKYQYVKLILVLYIRNSKDEKLKQIINGFLSNPETQIQKLIVESFGKLNNQAVQMQQEKPLQQKKPNKMKAHFEKMKKQQQNFMKNNQDLFKQVHQAEQKLGFEQQSGTCLICHQPNNQTDFSGFILTIKNILIEKRQYKTFLSCGHFFHRKCLKKQINLGCPVCKHSFNNFFTLPPSNMLVFLDPKVSNKISHNVKDVFYNFAIENIPMNKTIEIVQTRTYLSILGSLSQFLQRTLRQLRSIYCRYCSYNELPMTQEDFQSRCSELLKFKVRPSNKIKIFLQLLKFMYWTPFFQESIQTKKTFEGLVTNLYTKFMACNYLCFLNGVPVEEDIQTQFKPNQQVIKAQMNEFCKGIVFVYNVLFDDQRNKQLQSFCNEDHIAESLISLYPQFFSLDKELFKKAILKNQSNPEFSGKEQQSLIPTPTTIEIAQNYMQFHSRYNNLKCDQCKGFINVQKDESLMCLQCGYKACLQSCPSNPTQAPLSLMHHHLGTSHCNEGILFDLNSSLVYIQDGQKIYIYGYLYQNKFGENDSDEIKDWKSLKINNARWNKLLQLLRKRTMNVHIIQANLKQRQIY